LNGNPCGSLNQDDFDDEKGARIITERAQMGREHNIV
jgi:hypothetical protein